MSNHRVKSVRANDDDYDYAYDEYDSEGDGELNEEDKEQMRLGTINVRDALGSEIPATDDEIQEALWHYYYDIAKSVSYIKNKRKPAVSKTPKAAKTKDSGATNQIGNTVDSETPTMNPISLSMKEFFADTPWLQVPPERRTKITMEPRYPELGIGLLGGASEAPSGKVSKLAALAAARRKRENTPVESGALTGLAALRKPRDDSSKASEEKTKQKDELTSDWDADPRLNTPTDVPHFGLPIRGKRDAETAAFEETNNTAKSTKILSGVRNQEQPDVIPESKLPRYRASEYQSKPSSFASAMFRSRDTEVTTESNPSSSSTSATPVIRNSEAFGRIEDDEESEESDTEDEEDLIDRTFGRIFGHCRTLADFPGFAGPSPDAIVLNARNSKGLTSQKNLSTTGSTTKTTSPSAAVATVDTAVKELTLEPAKFKSKNLDVAAEYKKTERKQASNFVVIGHVDAGKSTLMGRLLLDLKAIDQRTVDKYRKESERIGKGSFALAWVLDQGTEERARGVTIDIATNKFETENTNFTILDAPGHRDFVPNMIAGASEADFAVLVIDASTGNFESGLKGQTKEHALLVRSMGVQKIIVAVNKMDSVQWSYERFEEIQQQISSFLTTAGFQPKNVSFIPCSGLKGDNIARKSADPSSKWYTGNTLVEELETSEPISKAMEKPLRLPIGDIFRGAVQNPLSVSGRIDAGTLQAGEQICVMPSGERAIIKSLEVDQEPSDWAVAGQNVTLNLTDIDPIHLRSGDIICSPRSPIKNVSTISMKILAFDHLTPMHVEVLKGRLQVPGKITELVATLDKGTGEVMKKKPRLVQPGSLARITLQLGRSVPLEAPGRVVLRANGETVAAGLLE